jgi:hypothetical protein
MTAESIVDGISPALKWLDQRIAHAVVHMQSDKAVHLDQFRGLHIGPKDVARWLDREPGVPAFNDTVETPVDPAFDEIVHASPRFSWLAQAFGLSAFDLRIVLIALAPEVRRCRPMTMRNSRVRPPRP